MARVATPVPPSPPAAPRAPAAPVAPLEPSFELDVYLEGEKIPIRAALQNSGRTKGNLDGARIIMQTEKNVKQYVGLTRPLLDQVTLEESRSS